MPENTVTAPLAPMQPDDVADAFAYIRALHTSDIDTAGAVADDIGPEKLYRLLVDVAARVFIPITAVDDHDGEPCAHSFLAAALGRLLLELACHGVCLASSRGIADTITRLVVEGVNGFWLDFCGIEVARVAPGPDERADLLVCRGHNPTASGARASPQKLSQSL
ncbi:hypothetical protein ACGFXC_36630 [Streptomyces sp. NPDC048507]|uniref:hypothetical protein n=1 Tax=Streptomyces sp. NPDC048507 TaxID=3365560 RepID=UPI00372312E1